MPEMTITTGGDGIEEGEYELTVTDRELVWLDDEVWEEVEGPDDPELVGDATGKYNVTFEVEGVDYEMTASWWWNDGSLGPNSGMGEFMHRIGAVSDFEGQEGDGFDPDDVFEIGRKFRADIRNDPNSDYHEIDDVTLAGHDDDDFEDGEAWGETLTPLDSDGGDNGDTTGSSTSESNSGDVDAFIFQQIPEDGITKGKLSQALAQNGFSEQIGRVNEMVDEGILAEDDGTVTVA